MSHMMEALENDRPIFRTPFLLVASIFRGVEARTVRRNGAMSLEDNALPAMA